MTVIYTGIFGGFDRLIEAQAEQDIDCRWICFTDDPKLAAVGPWSVILQPRRYEHPRMSSKWHKFLPHRALPDADVTIWIDGSMQVTSPAFASEACASMHDDIAIWRHPRRSCIYEEAAASLRLAPKKYAQLPILEQVEHYRVEGYPAGVGLYASGTIARDSRTETIRALGEMWLAECERWTYQDQLSFPVVCRRLGVQPGVFPHAQWSETAFENPWLRIHEHLSDT